MFEIFAPLNRREQLKGLGGGGIARSLVAQDRVDPLAFIKNQAGLIYCYLSEEPNSFFTDTAGTIPATASDLVAHWRDLSGNGNHLIQATIGSRPVMSSDGGKTTAYFASKFLSTATLSHPYANGMQIFTIWRMVTTAGFQVLYTHGNLSDASDQPALIHDGGVPVYAGFTPGAGVLNRATSSTNVGVVRHSHVSGTNGHQFEVTVADGSVANTGTPATKTMDRLYLGSNLSGGVPIAGAHLFGHIAISGASMNNAQAIALQAQLRTYFGGV